MIIKEDVSRMMLTMQLCYAMIEEGRNRVYRETKKMLDDKVIEVNKTSTAILKEITPLMDVGGNKTPRQVIEAVIMNYGNGIVKVDTRNMMIHTTDPEDFSVPDIIDLRRIGWKIELRADI